MSIKKSRRNSPAVKKALAQKPNPVVNDLLPGLYRYQPKSLIPYFGYNSTAKYITKVEIALLESFKKLGIMPERAVKAFTPEAKEKLLSIMTTQMDLVENEETKHDIRAWVKMAHAHLNPDLRRFVHLTLTSYDPISTGSALQYKDAHFKAIAPLIRKVIEGFIFLIKENESVPQIGRTHGQHAEPITFGFWFATVLQRILYNAEKMDLHANEFVGKISGAVGNSLAQVQSGIDGKAKSIEKKSFERIVLAELGLKPAQISTQILPPEPLAYYLFSCVGLASSLAQFARDCRHLMRTEINEIRTKKSKGQAGSSAMPHKNNPIDFEQIEGMYIDIKHDFGKVLDNMISEHQRDLVGSSILRKLPMILIDLACQLERLTKEDKSGEMFLKRLVIDKERAKANIALRGDLIYSEMLYVLLAQADYDGDAHSVISEYIVPKCVEEGLLLIEGARRVAKERKDRSLIAALKTITTDGVLGFDKAILTGKSAHKAREIVELAEQYLTHSH